MEVHILVQEDKMESSAVKIQERGSQRKQSNSGGTHSNKQENENKKCQAEAKSVCMQPVKNTENKAMWLFKPLVVPKEYRRLCKDNACQSTRCYKNPVKPKYNYDKNCQTRSSSEQKIQMKYEANEALKCRSS